MFRNLAQHMTPRTASFALLLGGAMWGLFWIPVRHLEHLGLEATWAGVFIYISTLLLGLERVDHEVKEAAVMSGGTRLQQLFLVELPSARVFIPSTQ